MVKKTLIVLAVICLIAGAYMAELHEIISLAELKEQQAFLQNYYYSYPVRSVLIFAIGYIIFTALTIPGQTILTLAGGAIFGSTIGVLVVPLAATTGALVAFWLARYVLRDYVQKRFNDRLKKVNEAMAKDGPSYLFSARLLPVVPFPVLNAVMALTEISSWQYFYISYIAMLPGVAIFTLAGTRLSKITSVMDVLSVEMFLLFGALGLLPWLPPLLRFIRRKLSGKKTTP